MKLFEMKNWQLIVSEEAWGLLPFAKILKRDKGKYKEKALKEMLFIFFFCDIKSNYIDMPKEDRVGEIKHDIGLEESWEIDDVIQDGIDLYTRVSVSTIQRLYMKSSKSIDDIGEYLANTKALLAERDSNGKPVYDIGKLVSANEKVPKLMANLKSARDQVIQEKNSNEDKKKGSKLFNTFEDGFNREQ